MRSARLGIILCYSCCLSLFSGVKKIFFSLKKTAQCKSLFFAKVAFTSLVEGVPFISVYKIFKFYIFICDITICRCLLQLRMAVLRNSYRIQNFGKEFFVYFF